MGNTEISRPHAIGSFNDFRQRHPELERQDAVVGFTQELIELRNELRPAEPRPDYPTGFLALTLNH